jgi:sulfhydrogenase subunit beta (sulfur reductase)
MSGNGTTGVRASPGCKAVLTPKESLPGLLDSLRPAYGLAGPVPLGEQTVFSRVDSAGQLKMDYSSTMAPPGKLFLYPSRENILRFRTEGESAEVESFPAETAKTLLLGVHACDVHAVVYLDKVFHNDPFYRARRENTLLVAINCTEPTPFCFCSSVGTGPFLRAGEGYDAVLTDLGEHYLVELVSDRAGDLLRIEGEAVGENVWRRKAAREEEVRGKITKRMDVEGLDELLLRNTEHPVWSETADSRCLSCANCVMVCPTCFCHDIVDRVDMALTETVRFRHWDACQDQKFAAVHGGNFRRTRAARLRQFVMHKLDYTAQFDTMGTVGCGRCIQWCPTRIDLTEMAKEIQRSPGEKPSLAR